MLSYTNFFPGSTGVAGARTGLLFVSLSIAPGRLTGEHASAGRQSIAATAFAAHLFGVTARTESATGRLLTSTIVCAVPGRAELPSPQSRQSGLCPRDPLVLGISPPVTGPIPSAEQIARSGLAAGPGPGGVVA
jgi:hypothetical protein